MEINYEKAPTTGGLYYDYLNKETFEAHLQDGDQYDLKDLKPLKIYDFYRIAKTDDNEILYMRIRAEFICFYGNQMFFSHNPTKGKLMIIDGYKETWFFIPAKLE